MTKWWWKGTKCSEEKGLDEGPTAAERPRHMHQRHHKWAYTTRGYVVSSVKRGVDKSVDFAPLQSYHNDHGHWGRKERKATQQEEASAKHRLWPEDSPYILLFSSYVVYCTLQLVSVERANNEDATPILPTT